MQTVMETPVFTRKADALLSEQERTNLINLLAWNPLAGDVIPGTGGVRKLRFAGGGRGKRGLSGWSITFSPASCPSWRSRSMGKTSKAISRKRSGTAPAGSWTP